MVVIGFIVCWFLFTLSGHAQATSYYVNVDLPGSDSNDGLSTSSPFLTIAKAHSVTMPGDTVIVEGGDYTARQSATVMQSITRSGTSSAPITYKSSTPLAAKLNGQNMATSWAFIVTASHIVIEGFDIYGFNSGVLPDVGTNLIVKGNRFRDLGRRCHWSDYGQTGLSTRATYSTILVTHNVFANIGRYAEGESGCTYVGYANPNVYKNHDHGLYVQSNNVTITHNYFYSIKAGWSIQIYPTSLSNLTITHNVFAEPNPWQPGSVIMAANITTALFANNIGYSAITGIFQNYAGKTYSGVTISHNLTHSGTAATFTQTGVTITGNIDNTDPLMVDPSGHDFSLTSSSPAIGAGVAISGFTTNGTADIGTHETLTYSGATINEAVLDVTIGMSTNTPVVVTTPGWSVGCSGGANCGTPVVASATKLTGTDSVVRLTLSGLGGAGVCEVGQTWTVTYNSATGATTDSALIGGTANQELTSFTAQAVTNNCGAGAPPADPGTPHIHYTLDDNTGTNANDESANNLDGTLTNGPTWVTGKHGFAVQFANQGDDYLAVPYGNAVNPSTQSLTVCMGVLPNPGLENARRTFYGAALGTNQSWYLSNYDGTWSQGIQASAAAFNVNFPVSAGWAFICQVMDSGTDTATLYVNGVAGTSAQSVKTYTSYAFASNVTLGRGSSFLDSVSGGMTIDQFKLYTSALSAADILDLYNAWEPVSPPVACTMAQTGHQFHLLRQSGAGAMVNYGTASGAVTVIHEGAFQLTTQVDATVAACSAVSLRTRYSHNGGPFLEVPDFVAAGQVTYFYGSSADADILHGVVTCCLTGALTANDGSTQMTAAAVPNFTLAQNASITNKKVLRLGTGAQPGDTVCYKDYNQNGNALDAYTPASGACVTVMSASSGTGL